MTNQPQQDPSQAPNGSSRAGVLDVLLVVGGLVLLLPGLCAMALVAKTDDGSLWASVAISIGGLWLIIAGLRTAGAGNKRKPLMRRHIVLTILMVIIGAILLLPGVCALVFIVAGGFSSVESSIVMLWIVSFLISAAGVWLIVKAFR
jgi:hypothetical protein